MKSLKLPLFFVFTVFGALSLSATNIGTKAELILRNSELIDYHGWLKYLDYRIEDSQARLGLEAEETIDWISQRDAWVVNILEDPDVLKNIRGTQEWAYFSEADDSGQPFRFATPLNYDPEESYGLLIYIHGYSGNHIEHLQEMPSIEGNFRLSVLGRARGGFYQNLSENDVVSAIKFMLDHWNIDPRRIHFTGGSMGGWASFYLTNRYPHLVASSRPTCGFAPNLPVGNWLHIPFYATHSQDDPVVPIVMSRVPLHALQSMGGQVVIDETDGLGHSAWDYAEGNERGAAWYQDYSAPCMKTVRKIDYTATDGKARKGYWATIETWGSEHLPARMQLNLGSGNDLYVQLENTQTISIDVLNSPIQKNEDLSVLLDGAPPVVVPAPLPETLYIEKASDGRSQLSETDSWKPQKGVKKHYPGGARNLFNGEPLLVVWGTQGNAKENAALLDAAESAMRSAHPSWTSDEGQQGPDGVIHEHMTYSHLKGKPDIEVTEDDMKTHHLVLIGSSELNSVAASLSETLPVQIHSDSVSCDDGVDWKCEDPLVFLTYFNPLNPDRSVYWTSTGNVDFLTSGWQTTEWINAPMGGVDFALFDAESREFCAVRTFDTDWNWSERYQDSEMIPDSVAQKDGWYRFLADSFIEATGADAAIVVWSEIMKDAIFTAGESRYADIQPLVYAQKLAVMELSDKEMKALQGLFQNLQVRRGEVRMLWDESKAVSSQEPMESDKSYKVVMMIDAAWSLAATGRFAPESLKYVEPTVWDMIKSYLNRIPEG